MTRLLFLLFFLFSLALTNAVGQNVDPGSVDVSALSEAQISRLVSEMQRRGMSESEVLSMARARGVSEQQISILRSRIASQTLGNQKGLDAGSSFMELEPISAISEKPFFIATQEEESLFGFQLFNSENLTFQNNISLAVTPNYLVGPEDSFTIQVYGASQQNYLLEVDKSGNITIPHVGPIMVGGFDFKTAERRIREQLNLIYRDLTSDLPETFVNIQISEIKTISVSVVGEVFAPGTYTLPGTATAFAALYLSGGPNIKGSFRNIKVLRDGKEVSSLDVYEYLVRGNGKVDIPLRDGDVIMVPTYGNRVRVDGQLIRNGIFESKEGETISDLIEYAGGFTEKAYQKRISLTRNTGTQRELKDVYTEEFVDVAMQNGDVLFAGEILGRFENRVEITGAVFRPGVFELTDGLDLKSLIEKADGVREDAFIERGLILRLNDDLTYSNVAFNVSDVVNGIVNIPLRREDVVNIKSIEAMREERIVMVYGEVLNPGEFPFRTKLTLGDIVTLSGGFRESASNSYIEVTRRLSYEEAAQSGSNTAHLFQFSISRNLNLSDEEAKFALQPFDQIFVRRAPGFATEGRVTISGEINYAGQYALVSKNERLSDLINRSGGVTADSYIEGAMLTRQVNLTAKERRLREATTGKVDGVDLRELGFEVLGVDLAKAIKNPGGREDVFLRDGDELVIPRQMQIVQVDGHVLNPLSMPHVKGKSVKYYVNQSGGFGLRAKRNRAYVVYPNGRAAATRSFLFVRAYPKVTPGSNIYIPEKPEKIPLPPTAWVSIGTGVASMALTIVTVVSRFTDK